MGASQEERGDGMIATATRPSWLTDDARRTWEAASAPTPQPELFDRSMLEGLPAPVRKWLTHAIADGAPLRVSARIWMHGEIKIGSWRPFEAAQVLAPWVGFVWAATAHLGPLRIKGFDRYEEGAGEMRWRIARLIPVLSRSGPDISRSGAGRLAAEVMLIPTAALGDEITWRAVDDYTATAGVTVAGAPSHSVTIEIDDAGALRTIRLPRWGDPNKGAPQEHVFGVEVAAERSFGDITTLSRFSAGWWPGTDRWAEGEFFRAVIDEVELL